MSHRQQTIVQSLGEIGIDDVALFSDCDTRDDEFKVVRKQYYKKALTTHPDKGGEKEAFQRLQTAFELLKDLHTGKKQRKQDSVWLFSDSFRHHRASKPTAKKAAAAKKDNNDDDDDDEAFDMSAYDFDWSKAEPMSYEFYQEAAEDVIPQYRVELAKSGRSKCTAPTGSTKKCREGLFQGKKGEECHDLVAVKGGEPELIAENEIRVGWLDEQSGTHSSWKHLRCWRVPHKVWVGLPDPHHCKDPSKFAAALAQMEECVLTGFVDLPHSDQRAFVDHCCDKKNWARPQKKKRIAAPPAPAPSATAGKAASDDQPAATAAGSVASKPLVPASSNSLVSSGKKAFVIPRPGINGASSSTVFDGKRFVLTGTFPEVGGGGGLNMGKDKAKAMIELFGGRVTGSISGKTDVLVVGKDPGMSKVSKARANSNILLASLRELKDGLDKGLEALEEFDVAKRKEPMKIQNFSSGYQFKRDGEYNGLALGAPKKDLLIAQGLMPHPDATKAVENNKQTASVPLLKDDPSNANKKRPALKDVPTNSNAAAGTKKEAPATKKRKTTKKAATKKPKGQAATADDSCTAIVVADKKKKTTKNKKGAPKKPKMVKTPSPVKNDSDEEMENVISCDLCGADCTAESWLHEAKGEDYCLTCFDKDDAELANGAVLQRNGLAVE